MADPLEYYPGSRRKIEVPLPKKQEVSAAQWDAMPFKKWIGTKQVELFTIKALCLGLGRPAVTVRLWIRQGHLPQAPFKLPDKNGIRGRRMYSREHVAALLEVAYRHGIVDIPRVDWTQHQGLADEIRKAWDDINT